MKTRTWIIIFVVIGLIFGGLSLWILWPREAAAMAEISSDGAVIMTLDLSEDRTVTVTGENGTNIITVNGGSIAVTEADCPDQHCVKRGFCSSGTAIVCLPNRLVIRFVGKQTVDGAVG